MDTVLSLTLYVSEMMKIPRANVEAYSAFVTNKLRWLIGTAQAVL